MTTARVRTETEDRPLYEAMFDHEECMLRYPVEERVSFDVCSNSKCKEAREQEAATSEGRL